MSFTKVAVGLGLVVLLLPTDKEAQAKVFQTAAAAVDRAWTFCDRNPTTCTKAAAHWAVFKSKAQFGAEMAWSLISERGQRPATETAAAPTASAPTPVSAVTQKRVGTVPVAAPANARGTLTTRDMETAWRGKTAARQGT